MADALPARASLAWLRKTAKQNLRIMRTQHPHSKLAEAQLSVARQYGFSSWRSLKAHIDRLYQSDPSVAGPSLTDADIATFLRAVGDGLLDDVSEALVTHRKLVDAVGPHPYWGGRPQALHVSIETKRRDMFDLLVNAGSDINGNNTEYEHWSPLMLTFHWDQPGMREVLMQRGARVGLIEAMLLEDDETVEKMLRGGKLPAIEPNGGSLLAFARTPFAIDRLLDLAVSRDRKDRWDTTPMEAMSRLGPRGSALVHHLVKRGVKAAPQEYARLGDRETLAHLVRRDPAIARSDAVMMAAVDFGHHELARWLLSQGANVNARANWGGRGTALHSAAWNGDLAMVKLLVAAGADIGARDAEYDNTPAGFAKVAITVSNNPRCKDVADYLSALQKPST